MNDKQIDELNSTLGRIAEALETLASTVSQPPASFPGDLPGRQNVICTWDDMVYGAIEYMNKNIGDKLEHPEDTELGHRREQRKPRMVRNIKTP